MVDAETVETLDPHQRESGLRTEREIERARRWLDAVVPDDGPPEGEWIDGWIETAYPFGFEYDGEPSGELLDGWTHRTTTRDGERTVRWTDPETGLCVEWELEPRPGYPAIDWVCRFENTGEEETPLIEDVRALDLRVGRSTPDAPFVVHGVHGGRSEPDDFTPFSRRLPSPQAQEFVLDSRTDLELGGTDLSSNRHLPFFAVETPDDRGLIAGVGWSGSWTAGTSVDDGADELRTRVGLEETRFTLEPGESVRSPRVLVLFWDGERLHGHNMFRRLLYEQYVPDLRGDPQRPLVTSNTWFADYEDDHFGGNILRSRATADTASALADTALDLGVELFIVDTGWYETTAEYGEGANQWRSGLGQWTCDREKYPDGFEPIVDRLDAAGAEFGLWFAPEIAGELSPLRESNPGWLTATRHEEDAPDESRLRLEQPGAREWFLDRVERLIDEGLTCYRQDLYHEYGTEPEHRTGVSEMEHLAGLYDLWDALRERHPELIMEGCCGGGRRIDLETVSRFHWHQKSDRWYDAESDQCGLYGANLYLPGGVINVPTERVDDYGAWSAFAGQLCVAWDGIDGDRRERAREQIARYKRLRHRLSGDFYPLTPCSLEATWLGYQFHRSDLGEGLALVFKRHPTGDAGYPESETFTARLRGVDPEVEYAVRLEGGGRETTMTGEALAAGVDVEISGAPGAELIAYEPA